MAPPVLPRAEILSDLRTAFLAITGSDWNYSVATVQVGLEITRNFNMSQLPLVMIDPSQNDEEDRETFGASTANRHHRRWPIEITGIIKPLPNTDVRAEGEKFLSDLVKKIVTLTLEVGSNAQQVILIPRRILGPDNFERSEHKVAVVGVDLDVVYMFTAAGL